MSSGLRGEDGVAAFVLPGLDQHVGGIGAGVDGARIKAAVGLGVDWDLFATELIAACARFTWAVGLFGT